MVLRYHPHRATLFNNLNLQGTPYYMDGIYLFISHNDVAPIPQNISYLCARAQCDESSDKQYSVCQLMPKPGGKTKINKLTSLVPASSKYGKRPNLLVVMFDGFSLQNFHTRMPLTSSIVILHLFSFLMN